MPIPADWLARLSLPLIAAPMFLASGPDLVVSCCRAGVVGTFPALNQRTSEGLDGWLSDITEMLSDQPDAAPMGVNLIVHRSNPRLAADLDVVVKHKVPLVITSLGAVADVVDAVHSYGGLVFHDVIGRPHAEKAAAAGVDGIIAVAAGAGGHGGTINPFPLLAEIREVFDGLLILSGAMNTGRDVAAARMMGADFGYMGTRFIATRESMVSEAQKAMTSQTWAADIFYTPNISGVHANFLRPSIVAVGLDPDALPAHGKLDLESEARAWKTVWSAGQGVGGVRDVPGAGELCRRMAEEYRTAFMAARGDPFLEARRSPS